MARAWRALRTGLAFAVFGGLGLLLGGAVFPVLRLFERDAERGALRAQWILHLGYRGYLRLAVALGLIDITRIGAERLRQSAPVIVVANHPTLIDMPLLVAMMPQADNIVSGARAENRFLRNAVAAADYIRNDAGPAIVRESVRRLRHGRHLVLFPEGTRSPVGGLGPFQRGAAHIALASGCPLQPVVITSDPPTLKKGQAWWDVPDRTIRLTVRVVDPIAVEPHGDEGESSGVAARKLTARLREVFVKELGYADA
jgi:1-acyl-sn-glycerol-3-phosphate acyltransferase